ncbi:MAG: class I SAM-dependent DNA methyltransferase, partial [Candidatus Bipolaricaulia bacterium]
ADTKVLDPACGSGNFLYVALRELLDLEKEVIALGMSLGFPYSMPTSDPRQLYGIEINEYAHELAQATVWIGYIQWLHENGFGWPAEPLLKKLDNIEHKDAILAFDANGNPVEPEWPEATAVIGNPPFLGNHKLRGELGDQYVEGLFALYEDLVPGTADLCCYWFENARAMIAAGRLKRAGLLATQGIRGSGNRKVLERIKETGEVFWAHSDRDWVLDGAAVHVSMIGFDNGAETERELDGESIEEIHADLSGDMDVASARPLAENGSMAWKGPSPNAPFDVSAVLAARLLASAGNPNGRPNSDVVKPVSAAIDLTRRPRGMWTIDFAQMSEVDACQYAAPFEYIREHVYPIRSANRRKAYAERWWQYGEPRPGLREALRGLTRFVATPRYAKHRTFSWLQSSILANDNAVVFARDDDYFFGVLHSRMHELWTLRRGTRLEDRPRYTSTTCFETFPFPWPPGKEPVDDPRVQAIAAAAKDLVEKRDRWLNPEDASEADLKKRTLTNLYNQRPTWLDLAHKRLDEAVLDAYAWPHDLTDDQILERLLALNLERAGKEAARA